MKKLITIVIAALTLSSVAFAADRDAYEKRFRIGPKFGVASSWLTQRMPFDVWDGVENRKLPSVAGYAGVSFEYEFIDDFILQLDAMYVGKGHNHRAEYLGLSYDHTWVYKYQVTLGYVQVPLYIGYRFMDDKISLMVGPEFGVNIYGHSKLQPNADSPKDIRPRWLPTETTKADVKKGVNPFNIGIGLQASYMFWEGLGLDLKICWGLNNTFANNDFKFIETKASDFKGHNLTVQFGLSYKFEM